MNLIEGHLAITAPQGVPIWDIDPYAESVLGNLEQFYRELREQGPFAYIPKYAILACGRYVETKEVFSDWERFVSSRGVGMADFKATEPWRPPSIILEVDPPEHNRTRIIMARALSPKVMRTQADYFKKAADELIAEILKKGRIEAVTELAEVYPTTVFPKIIGLKKTNARALVDYGAIVFNAVGPDNSIRRQSMAMQAEIVPWVTEQCLRENLEVDGIGAQIYGHADSGGIKRT